VTKWYNRREVAVGAQRRKCPLCPGWKEQMIVTASGRKEVSSQAVLKDQTKPKQNKTKVGMRKSYMEKAQWSMSR